MPVWAKPATVKQLRLKDFGGILIFIQLAGGSLHNKKFPGTKSFGLIYAILCFRASIFKVLCQPLVISFLRENEKEIRKFLVTDRGSEYVMIGKLNPRRESLRSNKKWYYENVALKFH